MTGRSGKQGKLRFVPALLAAAGLAFAIPGAGLAVGGTTAVIPVDADLGFIPFTPANVDPQLARQVAAMIGTDALRFTPASSLSRSDRTVTVAVRVDEATARAMSIRGAIETVSAEADRAAVLAVVPTRYNLGIARGYQSFAQPVKPIALPAGIRDMDLPDLSQFRAEKPSKPSRFQTRVAIEQNSGLGSPRTLDSPGDQSVEVAGSYRLGRNLDVTAGVRLSQDRDRLAPLTDGVEDSQAVYVGTQIRF